MNARSESRPGRGALLVGAGIFLSKLVGLFRVKALAHYLGASDAAAAFSAALRIPNFLQNLFGEGVLSASFIPVYARLVGNGDRDEADRVAGAVLGMLSLVTGALVAFGVLFTDSIIDAVAGGLEGDARLLAVQLVRIIFPGTGVLVLSAWCLGILNSHRRFFLSYTAPVIWNVCIIGALLIWGRSGADQRRLAVVVAISVTVGSVLQFLVQVPNVLRLLGRLRVSLSVSDPAVRQVLRGFGPVALSRGVVQLSAYIDTHFASMLRSAASLGAYRPLALLTYAQTIYMIPISLFGMAISAAELPAMSQASGSEEEIARELRARLAAGVQRTAFFVIPSAAAFLLLGDIVGGTFIQGGAATPADTRYLWFLLMGSSVGLLASTLGRLYATTFYALKDTRTPLAFAIVRVTATAALAYWSVRQMPSLLGVPEDLGGVGITATTGLAAWIEYLLLKAAMERRIGKVALPRGWSWTLWAVALGSGVIGLAIKAALAAWLGPELRALAQWGPAMLLPPRLAPVLVAPIVLAPFGLAYFGLTYLLKVPQAEAVVGRLLRRVRRQSGKY